MATSLNLGRKKMAPRREGGKWLGGLLSTGQYEERKKTCDYFDLFHLKTQIKKSEKNPKRHPCKKKGGKKKKGGFPIPLNHPRKKKKAQKRGKEPETSFSLQHHKGKGKGGGVAPIIIFDLIDRVEKKRRRHEKKRGKKPPLPIRAHGRKKRGGGAAPAALPSARKN